MLSLTVKALGHTMLEFPALEERCHSIPYEAITRNRLELLPRTTWRAPDPRLKNQVCNETSTWQAVILQSSVRSPPSSARWLKTLSELLFHAEFCGISTREKETRALHGRVLAINDNIVKSDFQGTNGFSGTGYFFLNRKSRFGSRQSWHLEEMWEGEIGKENVDKEDFSKKGASQQTGRMQWRAVCQGRRGGK